MRSPKMEHYCVGCRKNTPSPEGTCLCSHSMDGAMSGLGTSRVFNLTHRLIRISPVGRARARRKVGAARGGRRHRCHIGDRRLDHCDCQSAIGDQLCRHCRPRGHAASRPRRCDRCDRYDRCGCRRTRLGRCREQQCRQPVGGERAVSSEWRLDRPCSRAVNAVHVEQDGGAAVATRTIDHANHFLYRALHCIV